MQSLIIVKIIWLSKLKIVKVAINREGSSVIERYNNRDKILNNEIPHNNFKYAFAQGYEYKGQPIILTEYGGIAFQDKEGWGYGNQVESEEDFLTRFRNITEAIQSIAYISGYCYTQTTDVQQEVNGLKQ